MELADDACRTGGTGWYRRVTITEKEGGGGEEDQPHPPLLCVGWGEPPKWPNAAEGETVAAFLCFFGMSDPPPRRKIFFSRVCFNDEASGEYPGREVWQKMHRGWEHPLGWGVQGPLICV